jgi:hypothetical protein
MVFNLFMQKCLARSSKSHHSARTCEYLYQNATPDLDEAVNVLYAANVFEVTLFL